MKDVTLSPKQRQAFMGIEAAWPVSSAFMLWGADGLGKSTVLKALHARLGGRLIGIGELVDAVKQGDPMGPEESFYDLVTCALADAEVVMVDDLHLLTAFCGGSCHMYPRGGWIEAPMTALLSAAAERRKKLVFVCGSGAPDALTARSYPFGIDKFDAEDYEFLCRRFLPAATADRLDYAKVHRFAPRLNAHQIKSACAILARDEGLDTDRFIEYLRSQRMASNVELGEVEEVNLTDLKGIDDVIARLEANIIMPLENDKLAERLNIRPKRGVLLAGPPGTGKTSIGRALAHRLRSKFFLIDGTFISGTSNFYARVHHVFEAAKNNAPCIVFIDDSDVIFESGEEMGLYRYLLTMLDGLESESAGRICVMMTAMDVGNLPPAMIRSGRIELWLETRPPDEEARAAILEIQTRCLPNEIGTLDLPALIEATAGLTGADLKRVIEDGKILFAYDVARERASRPSTQYFLDAIETVRENKEKYAEAEARARQQRPQRPSWFDTFPGMSMMMEQFSGADFED